MTKTNNTMYSELQTAMTEDLYHFLKHHFIDVCSNGDIIVNRHIDNIYNNIIITDLYLINYVYDVWQEYYIMGLQPDPYWANL
jgi:hypothetical protein